MFRRRVARLSFLWPDCSLTGDAAFELVLHFRTLALLDRVGATARDQRERA
jgi:hypothetical protein